MLAPRLEPSLLQILLNRVMLPEGERDPAKVEIAIEALGRPLAVLDSALAERSHLLGDTFTIADLNVASVLGLGSFAGFEAPDCENVRRWFAACTARPSHARSQKGRAG